MFTTTVKWSLLLFGFYHLLAGLSVLGPRKWLQLFGQRTYSLVIPDNYEPRYIVCTKFLGAMAVALASFCFVVASVSDIKTQALFLIIFGVLFIARASLRYILRQEMWDAYQLDFKRSLKNIIFNVLLGMASILLGFVHYEA